VVQAPYPPLPLATKVLIIGSDIPDLSSNHLAAAVAALDSSDVVLGPAADGGYYLLGVTAKTLAKPQVQAGGLFQGIAWSSPVVLEQQVAAVECLGLRLAPLGVLPVLRDIDTVGDLREWVVERGASAVKGGKAAVEIRATAAAAGAPASAAVTAPSVDLKTGECVGDCRARLEQEKTICSSSSSSSMKCSRCGLVGLAVQMLEGVGQVQ
jgi:hypothetical protein